MTADPSGPNAQSIDLVLLHGFAATSFTWRNVVDPLSAHGRVIALDRDWDPLPVAVEATGSEIRRQAGAGPVLIGHSAGAELAALVAASGAVAVRGVVLVAPVIGTGPPRPVRWLARLRASGLVAAPLLRVGARIGMERGLRSVYTDTSTLTPEVVAGYRQPLLRPGVAEAMWAMSSAAAMPPLEWDRVRHIPCLVVNGANDRWSTPIGHAHAEVVTYAGCGHLPHEEQPDRFVDDVGRFLSKLPTGPS